MLVLPDADLDLAAYVASGVTEGAILVEDGRKVKVDGDGFWLGPTLFDDATQEMSSYKDEIFGPVLSVVRVKTYEEALTLINENPYGNGTAIFTNDGGAAGWTQATVESIWDSRKTLDFPAWKLRDLRVNSARCYYLPRSIDVH